MKLFYGIIFIWLLAFIGQINCDFLDLTKPRECHLCEGINCLRTNYSKTVACSDPLDICATVFDGFTVVAKACLLDLPELHRNKCDESNTLECHKCYTSLCNNLGREDFKCYECDSSKDNKCSNDLSLYSPIRCASPSSLNSYCYVQYKDEKVVRGCSTNLKHQRDCFGSKNCALCLPGDSNNESACNSFSLKDVPTVEPPHSNSNKIFLSLSTMLLLIFVNMFFK